MDLLTRHFKNGEFDKCKEVCKNKNLDFLFIRCCEHGHKDIAEWLISIYDKINIHAESEEAFRMVCWDGHKNIAEWLITLDGKIDIHAKNEWAFRFACVCGHKHIIEWLINLDGKVDIHAKNEWAFRRACECGHKDTAEWLINLDGKIDIHADNEYAFRFACENEYKHLAKWLTIFYDEIPESLKEHEQFIEYYNQTRIHHWSPENHHLVKIRYPSKAKIIEYLYILYQSSKIFEQLPMEMVFLIFKYLI